MPSEDVWRAFFDVEKILDSMEVNTAITDAADFACGYGTFTVPAAQRIRGFMHAIDIDPEMLRVLAEKSRTLGLTNVKTVLRDLLREGSGLENESVDYVMLFNILHLETPVTLLREAFRVLKSAGRVGIVHWVRDPSTPRGPPLHMRPTPDQCMDWCLQAGFTRGSSTSVSLKPYHFGLVMKR
jgi:ubiquinone/menaquinone biosynthesis C-methylase UbiE